MNSHTEGEIWGLCTHSEKDIFVTGSDDKTVRLWDMTKKVRGLYTNNHNCIILIGGVESILFITYVLPLVFF